MIYFMLYKNCILETKLCLTSKFLIVLLLYKNRYPNLWMSDIQIDIQIEIPKSHDFWNTISVIQINLDVSKETRV